MSWFVDALLARPTADSRRAECTQLGLILLWHGVVLVSTAVVADWWLGRAAGGDGRPIPGLFEWYGAWLDPFLGLHLPTLVLWEGLFAWLVFRVVNRRQGTNAQVFIRNWWRACAWGTLVVPLVCVAIGSVVAAYDTWLHGILPGATLLVAGPAGLAQRESRRSVRARWRPECPECGYALRGLREARCPECGTAFPTASRTFRRWAVRRFPWDRLQRPSWGSAYLRSMAWLVFLPARAARGTAVPDRWSRCARWAGVHVVITALAATVLADGQRYVRWIVHRISPPAWLPPFSSHVSAPPLDQVVCWAAQSFIACLLPLLIAVAIACLISLSMPGRHRAAKLGGVKWSLYAAPVLMIGPAVWYGVDLAVGRLAPVRGMLDAFPQDVPAGVLIVLYGVWWAVGMAASQYNRVRHWTGVIGYATAFVWTWLLVARVLFAPGPLEAFS